jgi:hypothetical protein
LHNLTENVFLLRNLIRLITPDKNLPDTSNSRLPIFFLQLGERTSLFFDKVLKQAALSNGKENVFVLTDVNFDLYKDYNCIDISQYAYGSEPFDHLYKHHSTNSYFFEKTCFDRWFMISALVKALNIPYFVYADCDVLIHEDLKPIHSRIVNNGYIGSTMYFENSNGRSITSAHTSFWSSGLLNDFCRFICCKYADEQQFTTLLKDALEGKFYDNTNVSDMILLDVFRTETKPPLLNLFTLEDEGICFDFNVNVAYNGHINTFKMHPVFNIKKLKQNKRGIYAQADVNGALVFKKFYTLHFQGYTTKTLIPLYVTSKTIAEYLNNHVKGDINFAIRKLRLFKNKIKSVFKKVIK